MKKVVVAIGNLNTGGGQSVVCKLIENINRDLIDVEVICFCTKNNTAIEEKVEAVAKVHYLDINDGFSLFAYRKFAGLLRRIQPDVVHAHLGAVQFVALWSIIHRKKIVITVHTTPEKAFSRNTEKLVRYGLKRKLVTLVAVSKDNCDCCKKYFNIVDSLCPFVNNGVDIHGIIERENATMFNFINVATHNENKNQRFIVECMKKVIEKHKNVNLVLVGDGPEHKKLIHYVNELSLNDKIIFVGEVCDPSRFYASSDVYLQSSHREAMPMSILEAMGFGIPVISTNVGGIKDVIDGNGFLVEDNDFKAYCEAMINMIEMPREDFRKLRDKSLTIVKRYSSASMAMEYVRIYENI